MGAILKSGVLVAALLALPFAVTNPYYLHLVVVIMIYGILLLGLDIVFGYTGEVSLGHAALLGVGAYAAGIMSLKFGIGLLPSIPVGIVAAALFGLLMALPALKVTGPYLAMVTLAFGTIVYTLINEMDFLTNGPMGITLQKPLWWDLRDYADSVPFFDMSTARLKEFEFYFLVAACLLASLVAINRLIASRYGRAFEALRDAPIASDCMGVSVYKHKVIAFAFSAGMAGLAGSLFAYSEQYVAPNNFGVELAIQFLLAVTLGGRKSRVGPLLGALIIVVLPNLLADIGLFRIIAGVIAARGGAGRGGEHPPGGEQGASDRARRAVRRVLRLLVGAGEDHRLQAVDLWLDDPVRRLLPAGRHLRLPPHRRRPPAPGSGECPCRDQRAGRRQPSVVCRAAEASKPGGRCWRCTRC